jgi:hypothetical protein
MMSFGWAAFWIALAAVIASGRWYKARCQALKYDTIVRLAEKTGRIDEEQFKLLFPPPGPLPPHWFAPPQPGQGRMLLRIFGTIALFVALGLATTLFVASVRGGSLPPGIGFAIILAFFGVGLFIAARFAPTRRADREAP